MTTPKPTLAYWRRRALRAELLMRARGGPGPPARNLAPCAASATVALSLETCGRLLPY